MKSKFVNYLCVLLATTSVVKADPNLSDAGSLPGFEGLLLVLSLLAIPIVRIIKRK